MKKGSIVLSSVLLTQAGKITAKPGFQLVSVFLGSVKDGDDPRPAKRMEDLGWRQMSFFETSIRLSIDHVDKPREDFEWRLLFSCLGAVDAVEAAVRFANKLIADELARGPEGTPAPYLASLYVGTMKIGPVDENGVPFNGRGPAFFGWKKGVGVSLEDHLEALRAEARRRAAQ